MTHKKVERSAASSSKGDSNSVIGIAMRDELKFSRERDSLIAQGRELKVTNANEYRYAMDLVGSCKDKVKIIIEHFQPAKRALTDAKRKLDDAIRGLTDPIDALKDRAWGLALIWQTDEEQKAETRRREEERRQIESEKQRREAEVAQAIQAGDEALANEILSAPIEIPIAETKPAIPVNIAVGIRKLWSAEITNLQALVNFIAANPQFLNLIQANQVALNDIARAQQAALKIPGVRAVSRDIPIGR